MNLLINAIHIDWSKYGGQAGYIFMLSKYLEKHINIYLITSESENNEYVVMLKDLGVNVFPLNTKIDGIGIFKYSINSLQLSYRICNEYNINIQHAHSILAGIYSYIIYILLNKPYIITFHGDDIDNLKWKLKKIIRNVIAKKASKIVLLNEKQRMKFLDHGYLSDNIEVIETAVNLNEFDIIFDRSNFLSKYNIDNDKKLIISLSVLSKRKNTIEVIKGFSNLPDNAKRDLQLIIAGDGPEKTNLIRESSNYGIQENIIFLGYIKNREDIIKLLLVSNIYILASLEEGLPFTVLEAMAAHTPVITSNVGGIPELIENKKNGLILDSDCHNMSELILKLIYDNDFAELLANNAYSTVEKNYSWNNVICMYLNNYRTFAGRDISD